MKTETYEIKKRKAAHLFLDGKCSLNMAIARCFFTSEIVDAMRALNEIREAFSISTY